MRSEVRGSLERHLPQNGADGAGAVRHAPCGVAEAGDRGDQAR